MIRMSLSPVFSTQLSMKCQLTSFIHCFPPLDGTVGKRQVRDQLSLSQIIRPSVEQLLPFLIRLALENVSE